VIKDKFIKLVCNKGFTPEQASKIFKYYVDNGILICDKHCNGYRVNHGVYWELDILNKALELVKEA